MTLPKLCSGRPDDSLRRPLLDAACSDALSDDQFDRLKAALQASEEARRLYLRYCTLEGDLHYLVRMAHADAGTNDECRMMNDELPAAPPVIDIHHSSFPIHHSELGGWAFSYAAATVVTGLLLLVLWAWTVSHDREFAGLPPHLAAEKGTGPICRNGRRALAQIGLVPFPAASRKNGGTE